MYYLVLFLILTVLSLLEVLLQSARVKTGLLVVAFLCLLLTSGFKYETGVDWRAYSNIIEDMPPLDEIAGSSDGSVLSGVDVGFKLLISLIKYLGGGVQAVFFFISLISTFFLTISVRRYLKYPIAGLLLYYGMIYFYLDMSGIRQATALALFFYSLQFIQQRKPVKHYLVLFFAFTIHWSVLFLIPIYLLSLLRINKAIIGCLIAMCMVLYISGIQWMTSLVPSIFLLLQNTNFVDKVVTYSTTEIFATNHGLSLRNLLHMFLLFGSLFLSLKYRRQLTSANPYFPVFYHLLVLQILIFFAFYEFPEIADRIKLYFYVSTLVVLVSVMVLIRRTIFRCAYLFFLCAISLFYGNVHILEKPIAIAYYPYQNYLVHIVFDQESTGEERLEQHISNMEESAK